MHVMKVSSAVLQRSQGSESQHTSNPSLPSQIGMVLFTPTNRQQTLTIPTPAGPNSTAPQDWSSLVLCRRHGHLSHSTLTPPPQYKPRYTVSHHHPRSGDLPVVLPPWPSPPPLVPSPTAEPRRHTVGPAGPPPAAEVDRGGAVGATSQPAPPSRNRWTPVPPTGGDPEN